MEPERGKGRKRCNMSSDAGGAAAGEESGARRLVWEQRRRNGVSGVYKEIFPVEEILTNQV